MGNIKKALALALALALICCLPVGASAAGVEDATIDYNKTASLDVYKYDLTRALADGAWNTDSYVSNGVYDQSVIDALGGRGYAVEGVEFTYLRVADIFNYTREEAAGDAFRKTATKIHNIKAYLLTALYNAPVTIGPFYSAEVRHDSEKYVSR